MHKSLRRYLTQVSHTSLAHKSDTQVSHTSLSRKPLTHKSLAKASHPFSPHVTLAHFLSEMLIQQIRLFSNSQAPRCVSSTMAEAVAAGGAPELASRLSGGGPLLLRNATHGWAANQWDDATLQARETKRKKTRTERLTHAICPFLPYLSLYLSLPVTCTVRTCTTDASLRRPSPKEAKLAPASSFPCATHGPLLFSLLCSRSMTTVISRIYRSHRVQAQVGEAALRMLVMPTAEHPTVDAEHDALVEPARSVRVSMHPFCPFFLLSRGAVLPSLPNLSRSAVFAHSSHVHDFLLSE